MTAAWKTVTDGGKLAFLPGKQGSRNVPVMRVELETEELLKAVRRAASPAVTLLDIGCGIRPQQLIKPVLHICAEPFDQYARALQDMIEGRHEKALPRDRHYLVIQARWDEVLKLFPERSVDTVCLLDVIEHLEKAEGSRLLRVTEKLAKRQVIVFTPLGFMPQSHPDGKDAWGMDGGKWQDHKSGWTPEDFDETWSTYTCKNFHVSDNKGNMLAEPIGAFFAMKAVGNSKAAPKTNLKHTRRQKAHILLDRALDFASGKS